MNYTSKAVYEYISKQTDDPIIERKQCRLSGQDFPIYQSDLEFYDKISPKFEVSPDYAKQFLEENNDITENFEYKDWKLKCKIPTPTLCPEERQRRRLAFRNERKLYKRKCDFVGNDIVSIHSPDKKYPVYDQEVWWSDKRNAFDYAKDIDIKGDYKKNFHHLLSSVPYINIMNDDGKMWGSTNSAYTNNFSYGKNCYMIYTSWHGEDSFFSSSCNHIKDVVDCDGVWNSQFCYQVLDCDNLYNCYFVSNANDCSHIWYGRNLCWCEECICCVNLQNAKYCILNKQVSKEEYINQKNKFMTDIEYRHTILSQYAVLSQQSPFLCMNNKPSSWVFGDGVFESKDVVFWYNIYHGEHCKYYYWWADNPRYWYDITVWWDHDYVYEGIVPDFWYHVLFTIYCWSCSNVYWSWDCHASSHLFGCVWLRNKEYCIFNKQYTKEEYNQLVPKIIAQMIREEQRWEFFDPQMSPFGYNETVAMEYYPLSKEEALKLGYTRSDYEAPFPKVEKFVQWSKLWTASCKTIHEQKPELLEKLLNYAVVCEVSWKPFRIIRQELDFYIKHNLPLPKKHPDIRHQERMNKRPWRTLYLRNCDKCGEEMLSVYDTNTKWQKIYCEKCYQKAIL